MSYWNDKQETSKITVPTLTWVQTPGEKKPIYLKKERKKKPKPLPKKKT